MTTSPPPALRPNLLGLPRPRLRELLAPVVDRPFRVEQVYRALHERAATSFEEMRELGRELREELDRRFRIERPGVDARHRSADGTVKYLLRLADGATVEMVDIPDRGRRTLCLSSQAGCALACRFCVTGFWGAGRDLEPGEIVGQVQVAEREPSLETPTLNLVFMGMGEPLLNLGSLEAALDVLFERISWRRITVSTAGVAPGIEAMAGWPRRPQLAVSLHAPDDERRSELMPINHRYPLAVLFEALGRFPLAPKQRITFEYLLLEGFNDAPGDADLLARRLAKLPSKVNLIPLNPDAVLDPALRPPSAARVEAFKRRLAERGVVVTVRRRRGDDVSAACGQLRAFGRDPRGFRRSNLSL